MAREEEGRGLNLALQYLELEKAGESRVDQEDYLHGHAFLSIQFVAGTYVWFLFVLLNAAKWVELTLCI